MDGHQISSLPQIEKGSPADYASWLIPIQSITITFVSISITFQSITFILLFCASITLTPFLMGM